MPDNHLTYSLMQRCDIEECALLAAQSFEDYEYFTTYFPNDSERLEFLKRALRSEYRTTFGKALFLVARQDGIIVAVSQVFMPDYRKPSSLQYLAHGWWRVLALPNQKAVNAWSKMDEEASSYCHSMMGGSTWYISSLTVAAKQRGNGIGSAMIKECIIPHIRREGATRLCLFTNSERNLRFYLQQGFHPVEEQQFQHNGQSLASWSLLKKL